MVSARKLRWKQGVKSMRFWGVEQIYAILPKTEGFIMEQRKMVQSYPSIRPALRLRLGFSRAVTGLSAGLRIWYLL